MHDNVENVNGEPAPEGRGPVKLVIFGVIAAIVMIVYIFMVIFGSALRRTS